MDDLKNNQACSRANLLGVAGSETGFGRETGFGSQAKASVSVKASISAEAARRKVNTDKESQAQCLFSCEQSECLLLGRANFLGRLLRDDRIHFSC